MSDVSLCCTAGHWMDMDESDICAQCKDHAQFIDDELVYVKLGIAWRDRKTKEQKWVFTSDDYEYAITIPIEEYTCPADVQDQKIRQMAIAYFPEEGGFDSMDHVITKVWVECEL